MNRFDATAAAALAAAGWHVLQLERGETLDRLRRAGAPFRGDRYFRDFAPRAQELPSPGTEIAYRAELVPNSLNQRFEVAAALVQVAGRALPTGAVAGIAPAAVYVRLLWDYATRTGAFPLRGRYTWAADRYEDTHLVVGVFGRDRPLIVAPLASGAGGGVGALGVAFPAAALPALDWLREQMAEG